MLRSQRAAVSAAERHQAARAASHWLIESDLFQMSQHIACYLSTPAEFDTQAIIEAIWRSGKQCYLPVLLQNPDKTLGFVEYQKESSLHLNRYQILEPTWSTLFPVERLDIVIVPLIAFDLQRHRLGSGGGYYDRTFAFLLSEEIKKPYLIGLGHQAQQVDAIPGDPWDIPLAGILTEKNISFFRK